MRRTALRNSPLLKPQPAYTLNYLVQGLQTRINYCGPKAVKEVFVTAANARRLSRAQFDANGNLEAEARDC